MQIPVHLIPAYIRLAHEHGYDLVLGNETIRDHGTYSMAAPFSHVTLLSGTHSHL